MTRKNIYIVGYFGHKNLGDEQYKLTFSYLFDTFLLNSKDYNIEYMECDRIKLNSFFDDDIIILGGGDVLNDYFLDQIILKFTSKPNKIIAVSVGLPYTNVLTNTNKLNIIDYIFIRTEQDIDIFTEYFHPHRIFYIPDLSYFLLNLYLNKTVSNSHKYLDLCKKLKNEGKRIIAISLNRHIYDKSNQEYYQNIVNSFSQFVKYLTTFGYHVVFLPFNSYDVITADINTENDILIHTEVYNLIKNCSNPSNLSNITNIDWTLNSQELFGLYKYFYATAPMRFHGCLFSIYNNVPMLPIFTTRKIKNLLLDINWNYGYQLDTNENDIPISLDNSILISRFSGLLDSNVNEHLRNKLHTICRDFFSNKLDVIQTLINVITTPYPKLIKESIVSVADTKIHQLFLKLQEFAFNNGCKDFRLLSDTKLQQIAVNMASFYLTNTPNSSYNYGLTDKMFDQKNPFNYVDEWRWIIQDHATQTNKRKLINNPYGLFNLNFIDQVDYSGAHRSGWQFVYDNIKYLHNEHCQLHLDLYLDRTFHWNKEVNKVLDLIPYKKDWIGFVHHTFDTSFSEYNRRIY